MKNIAFFITHKTLSVEHAGAAIRGLSMQEIRDKKKMDVLYVYNTHQDELSNDTVLLLLKKYNIKRLVNEIRVFDYDPNTHKSLGADVTAICNYALQNYSIDDRILLLKSDCVLSKNYIDDVLHLPDGQVFFVAPYISAKARITDDEIFEYCMRDKVVLSDDITFFVEDQTNSSNNDFTNRPGTRVTDKHIKFTSCYVITDFSCHHISLSLVGRLKVKFKSWGGVKFYSVTPFHVGTNRSFVVHKFHNIISENRSIDREGPVKGWLAS